MFEVFDYIKMCIKFYNLRKLLTIILKRTSWYSNISVYILIIDYLTLLNDNYIKYVN